MRSARCTESDSEPWGADPRGELGLASITAAGLIVAVTMAALILVAAGARVIDSHAARVAADLAAVSGAYAQYSGGDGCGEAERTAGLNGVRLSDCHQQAPDLIVTVSSGLAKATARAGPV